MSNRILQGICVATALTIGAAGGASAQGILLSQSERVELEVNGQVEVRQVGSSIDVGQTIGAIDDPVAVALPDGSLALAFPGGSLSIVEYRDEEPARIEIGLEEGVTYFESGQFPSDSYLLSNASGEPIRLAGTAVWVAQTAAGQIQIEVTEGAITFSNLSLGEGDEAVTVTYERVNGEFRIVSVDVAPSLATAERAQLVTVFRELLAPGGGLPLAGLELPSAALRGIQTALENALQASPLAP